MKDSSPTITDSDIVFVNGNKDDLSIFKRNK